MGKYQLQRPAQNPAPLILPDIRRAAISPGKPLVLMVGMHLTKTRGGITTLTADILGSVIKNDCAFVYLASQAEDFGPFRKILLALTTAVRFVAVCIFRRPQLVYVHIGSNASLYRESAFILLAKVFRKRIVAHFHAGDFEDYYRRQSVIGKRFIQRTLAMADRLVAVSEESAGQLYRANRQLKVTTIPNVINVSAFARIPSRDSRQHVGPVRLLFVGAVGKLKGENDLIDALAILKAKGLNIKVSVVGYDAESLRDRCEHRNVSDLIDHLGPVSMDKRISFFEKADIFVLPTYAEAMPISVIEAMAAGLAVVTTAVGGIPEIITDGEDGILFPCGDVEALAEKIIFLINNPKECEKLGKNARRRVREQMDFAAYTARLRSEMLGVIDSD